MKVRCVAVDQLAERRGVLELDQDRNATKLPDECQGRRERLGLVLHADIGSRRCGQVGRHGRPGREKRDPERGIRTTRSAPAAPDLGGDRHRERRVADDEHVRGGGVGRCRRQLVEDEGRSGTREVELLDVPARGVVLRELEGPHECCECGVGDLYVDGERWAHTSLDEVDGGQGHLPGKLQGRGRTTRCSACRMPADASTRGSRASPTTTGIRS